MLVFLPGDAPRCELLRQSLVAAGHSLAETIESADAWLCCQPLPNETGNVFRHETLVEMHDRAPRFRKPILVCLVSFQPSINWPPGFAHAAERVLQGNTAVVWDLTRVHVRTSVLERTSTLILGADSPNACAALQQLWQPLVDQLLAERIGTVIRAELEAERDSAPPDDVGPDI